jgi:hypothetical protein
MCLRAARRLAALLVAALVALLVALAGRALLHAALGTLLRAALAGLEGRNGRNRTTGNGRNGATGNRAGRRLGRQVDLEATTERATRLEARLERLLERTGRQDRLRGRDAATDDGNLGRTATDELNLTTTHAARAAGRRLAVRAGLAAKVAALGLGATDLALRARLAGLAASTTLDEIDNGRLHLLHTGTAQKFFCTIFWTAL